jgi:hypothetical protein
VTYGINVIQPLEPKCDREGTMSVDEWHPLWAPSRIPSVVHKETPMVMEQSQRGRRALLLLTFTNKRVEALSQSSEG